MRALIAFIVLTACAAHAQESPPPPSTAPTGSTIDLLAATQRQGFGSRKEGDRGRRGHQRARPKQPDTTPLGCRPCVGGTRRTARDKRRRRERQDSQRQHATPFRSRVGRQGDRPIPPATRRGSRPDRQRISETFGHNSAGAGASPGHRDAARRVAARRSKRRSRADGCTTRRSRTTRGRPSTSFTNGSTRT